MLVSALAVAVRADDDGWQLLSTNLDAFRGPHDGWSVCGDVRIDTDNRRRLIAEPGDGIILSEGQGRDLRTKADFGDCEIELEFMIPERSNSGVKLQGQYEIQILDSWKKERVTGSDLGGIYPRAELQPRYRTIDEGVPPRENAAREPGQWQTLRIVFRSPRFDEEGNKTANARFDLVELNGTTIHEDQEVAYPTGHAWKNPEHPKGPILLQGDHGPVAFRNLRVRPL